MENEQQLNDGSLSAAGETRTSEETVRERVEQFAAAVMPATADPKARTVGVVWYTGTPVVRVDYYTGENYFLQLSMDPAHVRLGRLNSGAPFLNAHSSWSLADVIGVVEKAWLENGQGRATVRFSEREDVDPIWKDVEQGIICNISVGASIFKLEDITPEGEKTKTYLAVDWEPREISAVPIPAGPGAGFLSAQQVQTPTTRAIPAQERTKQNMEETTMSGAGENQARAEELNAARLEAVKAERLRSSEIRKIVKVAKLEESFAEGLITNGTSLEDARTAVLNELANRADATPTRSHVQITRDGNETRLAQMENALLNRHNSVIHKLEAGREFRGMTLLEMAQEVLSGHGYAVRGLPKMELVKLAFHSTSDFPQLLSNTANKTLRAAYESAPQTWRPFCRQSNVSDFKEVSRNQLGDAASLEKVNANGEFKYGSIPEASEKYKIATYGKIFGVNRQAIINDDLGAFTRIPELQGRAAARLESDTVWGIIIANPAMGDGVTLFHANHGNVAASGGAIAVATLDVARSAMRVQKGLGNVEYLNLMPKFLIVPAAKETTAQQYVTQTNIVYAKSSDFNPFAGTLQVIAEPRLDAASTTAWYMACDPGQIDTIEYAYLSGSEGVYLETRTGFEVDGIEFKVRLDFGAKAIDHRGFYKNPGA